MRSDKWLIGWSFTVLILIALIVGFVYYIDPFFHYHAPRTELYHYELDNQRYVNDGITRSFQYNALITGTSMTENFKTSDMDGIFGVRSVKIPYSGAAYKEVNEGIERALKYNPDIKMVVRGIDMGYLFTPKDWMRDDLGTYPDYLYDNNPFNDVNYVFNQDIIFDRAYKMVMEAKQPDFEPGIPSFDDYSSWQDLAVMGPDSVCKEGIITKNPETEIHMTDEERNSLQENIEQNVTSLVEKYPQVEFYFFFTPYSMAWWNDINNDGTIYRFVEGERYAIELMLEYENIKLYSYNTRIDITSDLNNYRDPTHYGSWISTLILNWMHDGNGLITKENCDEYIEEELRLHLDFDYGSLNTQEDAPDDMAYGERVLERELNSIKKE